MGMEEAELGREERSSEEKESESASSSSELYSDAGGPTPSTGGALPLLDRPEEAELRPDPKTGFLTAIPDERPLLRPDRKEGASETGSPL